MLRRNVLPPSWGLMELHTGRWSNDEGEEVGGYTGAVQEVQPIRVMEKGEDVDLGWNLTK